MFSKKTINLFWIYIFILVILLFFSNETFGFILLLAFGIYTLVLVDSFLKDVSKMQCSIGSRIFTGVLLSTVLFLAVLLFYGLSNIGRGDDWIVVGITLPFYGFFWGASVIASIVRPLKHKHLTGERKKLMNLCLILILVVLIIFLFYSSTVNKIALSSEGPNICYLHLEIKDDSFIFRKGMVDDCIKDVATKANNYEYCALIEDKYVLPQYSVKNKCYFNTAASASDVNICYMMSDVNYDHYLNNIKARCIQFIAAETRDPSLCELDEIEDKNKCYSQVALGGGGSPNPDVCNKIDYHQDKYFCFSRVAEEFNDPSICDNVPFEQEQIEQGISNPVFTKQECLEMSSR